MQNIAFLQYAPPFAAYENGAISSARHLFWFSECVSGERIAKGSFSRIAKLNLDAQGQMVVRRAFVAGIAGQGHYTFLPVKAPACGIRLPHGLFVVLMFVSAGKWVWWRKDIGQPVIFRDVFSRVLRCVDTIRFFVGFSML